jgi:hypothetical protein
LPSGNQNVFKFEILGAWHLTGFSFALPLDDVHDLDKVSRREENWMSNAALLGNFR